MNTDPTPTSPKKIDEFERDRLRSTKYFHLFLIALVVGLLAGFFGFLIGHKFVYNSGEGVVRETVITESPASEEARAVTGAVDRVKPSIFHVADAQGELLGNALVITSDGWLVTNVPTDENSLILDMEEKEYKIKEKYFDAYSGADFIKISAENLRPAVFVNSEQVSLGEKSILYQDYPGFGEQLYKDYLVNVRAYVDEACDLDGYPYRFILDNEYPVQFDGGPVVNYQGEVMGLLMGGNVVLPARAFTTVMDGVISGGQEPARPGLRLAYRRLSQGSGEDGPDRGVTVLDSSIPELQKGDVIMYLNSIPADEDRDFADILLDFSRGDELEALVLRDGEQQTVAFRL